MEKRKSMILFVDDDLMILSGIRRSVEEYGDEWDVDFASSGNEALEKLAQYPFDAIVTDMHMPEMNGIELLDAVSQNTPTVLRFILSGNTDGKQIMMSTHLAHQVIPKPSDMEKIYCMVERACRLRRQLSNPQLLSIITGIKTLPSVPFLYNRLLKELHSEDTSSGKVANIIAQDAAMTAKILQLVNSAFFGLAVNVSSPQRAVTILGLNTIQALVLGIQVFTEYQGNSNSPISIDAVWKHSILVSNLAYLIGRDMKLNTQELEDARVSGVLHDIGKLLLFKIPDVFNKIQFNKSGLLSIESEYQVMNTSHAEMGAYLLGIWGLPTPIVDAVAFHHMPGNQVSDKAGLLTALYVSNELLNMERAGTDVSDYTNLDLDYLQMMGVIDRLDEWKLAARDLIQNSA